MRRLVSLATVAIAMATSPSVAAQSDPVLTYEWAQGASAQIAGQRMLGPIASLYPHYGGVSHSRFGEGWSVAFATTSRSSGMRGLCEVHVVRLYFAPQRGGKDAAPPDRHQASHDENAISADPAVLRSIDAEHRFKAISDTSPQPWTEEYEASLDTACARQTDGWAFSIADDANSAWYSARLQTILPDMALTQPDMLLGILAGCSGDADCRSPLRLVAKLRDAQLWHGEVRPCDAMVDMHRTPRFEGPFCLKAQYILGSRENEFEYLNIAVRFDEVVNTDGDLIDPHLRAITLRRERLIED